MVVAGTTIDVDERIMRGVLLKVVVELGFEIIRLLLLQVGVNDLRNSHGTDPMGEDGVGQRVNRFGFDSFKNGDFGGFIGKGNHKFVVAVRDERSVDVEMNGGVGNLRRFFCLLENVAVVAGF